MIVSSAKKRWDTLIVVAFLRHTENPDRRPAEVAASNILVKTSMTNKNKSGEIDPYDPPQS